MNSEEQKRLVVFPIVLVIAAGFAVAGGQNGLKLNNNLSIFAFSVIIAFVVQWIAFIPAFIFRTEKFYDLVGSLTYLTLIITSFLLNPNPDFRAVILTLVVAIWAFRLGSFLFIRVLKTGEDSRFREIKQSFIRFLVAWTIQGLWVVITVSAALAAITSENQVEFGLIGYLGLIIWIFGFILEVVADRQKSIFKSNSENQGKFINTGLWSISRHPNYFGEIVLWIGVTIIAIPVLQGWQFVTLLSPVFVILLLTKVSGIPLLENKADERWGGQEDYEKYKKSTPVLIPKFF